MVASECQRLVARELKPPIGLLQIGGFSLEASRSDTCCQDRVPFSPLLTSLDWTQSPSPLGGVTFEPSVIFSLLHTHSTV